MRRRVPSGRAAASGRDRVSSLWSADTAMTSGPACAELESEATMLNCGTMPSVDPCTWMSRSPARAALASCHSAIRNGQGAP
jgi:hypothetical protein